jgi:hypothetical protein
MDLKAHRELYRREHSTLGCKITHMFGVPLIMASLITVFFAWKIGLAMFVIGWALQFAGHYVFEKNKPVLFSDPSNPFTYFFAIIFVAEEWWSLITTGKLH